MIAIAKNVYFGDKLASAFKDIIEGLEASSVTIIVDENTEELCLPKIKSLFHHPSVVKIPSGEEHKNITTCAKVWDSFTNLNLDRNSLIINLGGGVISDLGGFCAATYKRGIRFINLPTTLLAQVDAGIGGKTAIDFKGYKNQIGVLQKPEYIFICTEFLQTLSKRELISGYAEVVKHSLIKDPDFWKTLSEASVIPSRAPEVIKKAVLIKHGIVEQDYKETGLRKILNFGHSIGHALESYFLENKNRKVLHGEAIAAGMLIESFISREKGLLTGEDFDEVERLILATFPYIHLSREDIPAIVHLLAQDKKNINGKLKFVLLAAIGNAKFNCEVIENECISALNYYINLKNKL